MHKLLVGAAVTMSALMLMPSPAYAVTKSGGAGSNVSSSGNIGGRTWSALQNASVSASGGLQPINGTSTVSWSSGTNSSYWTYCAVTVGVYYEFGQFLGTTADGQGCYSDSRLNSFGSYGGASGFGYNPNNCYYAKAFFRGTFNGASVQNSADAYSNELGNCVN